MLLWLEENCMSERNPALKVVHQVLLPLNQRIGHAILDSEAQMRECLPLHENGLNEAGEKRKEHKY